MDMYDEEIRARFLAGVDGTLMILQAAIERLLQAKEAGKADRPAEALSHYEAAMSELENLIKTTKMPSK